uniref:beta-glucuronidase LacZ4 n=1 Tax=uncultured Draconibacterium sp. TaxID=1573823 RepID=UPI003217A46C
MKLKLCVLLVLILAAYLPAKASRKQILLNNDWQFTPGYVVRKNVSERVDIPHTWNRTDAPNGELDYYRGLGNYEKSLFIDSSYKGKRLFLKFDGVNTISNVFINGKHIGEHRGGYTSFIFEITNNIEYGKENQIMVRVNNAPQLDIMPLLGDFNFYGGIYRDVNLIVTDQACISPLDYASPGVYLTQKSVSRKQAEVETSVLISNPAQKKNLKLEMKVFNGEKLEIKKEKLLNAGTNKVNIPFSIEKPRLWNGMADPFIYRVEVVLKENGQIIDQVEQPLGLRYFHVDANKGFFLNGEHLQLRGVCRHQDRSEFGNALRPEHHEEDIALIKEMGANSIRLSHYPHDPYFYKLLDQNGLVTWSEIPFVGPGGYRDKGFVDQESFKENGKQQLIEMIRQNYNHPSICFWGLFNELKQDGDDPVEYVKELKALANSEDPTRTTTAASNQKGDLNQVTDNIAWNLYFGWYGGTPDKIGEWADNMHKNFPNLNIGISEYGAGGSVYHHGNELKKPVANSMWHPEEWQAHFHEEHWKAIDQRPFLWGTYIWNMFDFGAAHRTEGDVFGRNDKGLVTFDRKIKKDAFWFYKANWNKDDYFVHIAQKRYTTRNVANTKVRAYSNCKEAELFVNGKSMGTVSGNYGIFVWENVALQEGENEVEVIGNIKKEKVKDSCKWAVSLFK